MSYLPLCFPGIQILDVWVAISVAGTVYFPSLESGKWSGLPRTPGTVSAVGKRDSDPMWAAKTGVGDEVGMVTLLPAVGREVQGRSEKRKGKNAACSLHLLASVWPLCLSPNSGEGTSAGLSLPVT